MLKNYFRVALRNLLKYKGYAFINIAGLATGMGVTILIGLWVHDELTFDQTHDHYDRIVQVMEHVTNNGETESWPSFPAVMAEEIRSRFGSDFKHVLQSSWTSNHILTAGDKKFSKRGNFFEPGILEMLSVKMLKGTQHALKDPHSIVLSASIAREYFGDSDPINQLMRIDNKEDVRVTGVFQDFPANSSFKEIKYILPWALYLIANPWAEKMDDPWGNNFTQVFAELAPHADLNAVSHKIHNVKFDRVSARERQSNPQVFLHPMSRWHLYSEFKNGVTTGGGIQFVWLFGIIGAFVLTLACINFMNLSTARSEKRAKEVGIRKSVGSHRGQLISQFFCESILITLLSFVVSLLLVYGALPAFNSVAGKELSLPFVSPVFWIAGLGFSLITGFIAGSYPALYLSSFQPVKVLKGTFRAGRFASLPRKILVVLQFSVSVVLIIGTVIVFRQIEFARSRPIGYDRDGLINIFTTVPDLHIHFDAVRNELKSAGAIEEMTEAGSPTTAVWISNGGFDWKGKNPEQTVNFPNNYVTYEFGKTVGWTFKEGRDFSREHATDSLAFVINETAAKFLGFKNPVGETLIWNERPYTIIGVITDMLVESPYEPPRPSLFHISKEEGGVFIMKLNRSKNAKEALSKVEEVYRKYSPETPFEYRFVNEDYARKFGNEERVGKLASFFASLAVLISCLGIFALASFVAEQRTKEIGVRKILGATVFRLWTMLSIDFVVLVMISFVIASPIAYYFMQRWLSKYQFHAPIAWWIFAGAGVGLLVITMLTVSYQSIKAARANPVNSLRSE
ncbi:ABC transporter permease [Chryseolinea soli]|uniref:FtsX-like permease family protein n=1 Tax=Chryseolinea soli TaxID=2321403 RepID=A0A385SHM9_9BACT|nr:ABC transporter permease [Chryseolinea soli]AYB29961.1 FtsX-like permease family protein [Chryseolinea soli]